MRKIPDNLRKRIFERWLTGSTQRDIAAELAVSLGTVSNVIDQKRQTAPDLDELRKLNLKLTQGKHDVHNALRGAELLDRVNRLGISIDSLESLIQLTERIASERQTKGEMLVGASLRLMRLEAQTNKTPDQIVQDLESIQAKATALAAKVQQMGEEAKRLNAEKANLTQGLEKARKDLQFVTATQTRLAKLDLGKVAVLAEHAEKEGELDRRITERKERLELLEQLEDNTTRHIQDIKRLGTLLSMRGSNFACARCGKGARRALSRQECEYLLKTGSPLGVNCPYCGSMTQYNLVEILLKIALEVLG